MTKLAFVSDVHLSSQNPICRKDDLRQTQWEKMRFVYKTAAEAGCLAVVFAGDLVDVACSWVLLPDLAEFLKKTSTAIDTYVVFGQHDTYMYDVVGRRKTIVGSLAAAGLISVLDGSPINITGPKSKTLLYGASYGQQIPEASKGTNSILVLHAPISNQELWRGQTYLDAKKFLAEHPSFSLIVCGDIHLSFDVKIGSRRIINTGPLLRRAADEALHQPHLFIYDSEENKLEKIHVPAADAEDTIDRAHLERDRAYKQLISQLASSDKKEDVKTSIKFGDILQEVVSANKEKINSNVVRLIAEITGINLEERHGRKKSASKS